MLITQNTLGESIMKNTIVGVDLESTLSLVQCEESEQINRF